MRVAFTQESIRKGFRRAGIAPVSDIGDIGS